MDRREQEAMALISKGQTGPAIDLLESLVRDAPNDWRARGRLAEVYLKADNASKAELHLRQVGIQMMSDSQYKPAIAIYKQIQKLAPKDGEIAGRLGECLHQSRFLNDAKKCYADAISFLAPSKPRQAAHFAQKLLELAPDETPVRVRFAELLDAAGEVAHAAKEWATLASQAEARGRPNDRARFLEKVLASSPSDFSALVGAAESRIAMGDAKAAFPHLQKAHGLAKDPVRVMELLARAFDAVGQATKARQVWLECAKAAAKAGVVATQRKALQEALRIQPDETVLQELTALGGASAQQDFGLSKQPWAAAASEAEERALTKAEIETRYGFPERAIRTLESAPKSVSVSVALAERLAAVHQIDGALRALESVSVDDAQGRKLLDLQKKQLASTVGVEEPMDELTPLEGELEFLDDEDLASAEMSPIERERLEPETLEELEPLSGEEPPDMATPLPTEGGPEAEGDRLAREGNSTGAMAKYREALMDDPANERVLMKIGELLSGDTPTPPEWRTPLATEPPEEEIEPTRPPPKALPPAAPAPAARQATTSAPKPAARKAAETPLEDEPEVATRLEDLSDQELRVHQARAWMAVYQYRDAIDAVHGVSGLAALVVRSDAKRFVSRSGEACASLQLGLAEASEDDPQYREALWVLSGLYVAIGKAKTAKRLLLELEELDPKYRADDVANRLRGLGMLERLK